MFKHEKQLFHPVAVEGPNPQYAVLLQEQLGGGNGELKAAMQYMSQSFSNQRSRNQRFIYGYRSGGTKSYGNGRTDD